MTLASKLLLLLLVSFFLIIFPSTLALETQCSDIINNDEGESIVVTNFNNRFQIFQDQQMIEEISFIENEQIVDFSVGAHNQIWVISFNPLNGKSIFHYNGQEWIRIRSPQSTYLLTDLLVNSFSDVWLLSYSELFHYNGQSWSEIPIPGLREHESLNFIVRNSFNNFLISGYSETSDNFFYHYDGQQLTRINLGSSIVIGELWASSPTNVFAIDASYSYLFHYDGRDLIQIETPPDSLLYKLWGNSPTNVWALGQKTVNGEYDNFLLHYNGQSWSELQAPPSISAGFIYDVLVSSSNDVWVTEVTATDISNLFHYNGQEWTRIETGSGFMPVKSYTDQETDCADIDCTWDLECLGERLGDTTGDGRITVSDISQLSSYVAEGLRGEYQGDVSCDLSLTVDDILKLTDHIINPQRTSLLCPIS